VRRDLSRAVEEEGALEPAGGQIVHVEDVDVLLEDAQTVPRKEVAQSGP
jgi:hypothetical protein